MEAALSMECFMGKPLSTSVSNSYVSGRGSYSPVTSRRGRGVLPSYATSEMSLSQTETITITIPVGALASAANAVVSGSQNFSIINSIRLANHDTGQVLLTNVSVSSPPNTFAGHPSLQVTSLQGNPPSGQLASGQGYTRLGVSAKVTVYATAASAAGNVVITATALLLGSALGD
jgi:hypothetical protein